MASVCFLPVQTTLIITITIDSSAATHTTTAGGPTHGRPGQDLQDVLGATKARTQLATIHQWASPAGFRRFAQRLHPTAAEQTAENQQEKPTDV